MPTLVSGVIVAGVGSNANPHNLREHIDVALSSPTDGDIIRYDSATGQWRKTAPSTLPVPSHDHSGVYVVPGDLTTLAPKLTPTFETDITVAGGTPTVTFNETDASFTDWVNGIRVDSGAMFFKMNGQDTRKVEATYVDYQALSLGLPLSVVDADAIATNPGCVRYIDATDGDVEVTLQAVGNYYRTVTRLTGVVLIFVREDASANSVTIVANGSDTIDGDESITLAGQKSYAIMQATDTGWRVIASTTSASQDTGWLDMNWYSSKLSDDRTSWGTSGMVKFQARKISDVVYLRGGMDVDTGISAAENVVQLPTSITVAKPTLIVQRSTNGSVFSTHTFTVKTDGYIAMSAGQSLTVGYTAYLDGVSFAL